MSSIKIAFFDIDWTLYDWHNKEYPKSAIEALKTLQKSGIKLFLCTARPYESMKAFGALNLGVKWDGYITSSGAVAFVGRKIVRKQLVEKSYMRRLCRKCHDLDLNLEIVTVRTRFQIKPDDEYTHLYHGVYRDNPPEVKPYKDQEAVGALLFAPEKFDEAFKSEIPELIYVRFTDYGVDVVGSPHVKGNGITDVLNYYGFKKEEAIAFGDEPNDISMADACGAFVCMGNGHPSAKGVATFVTDRIENDGLKKGLQHYGLIK